MDRWTSIALKLIMASSLTMAVAGPIMADSGPWSFPFPAEAIVADSPDSLTLEMSLSKIAGANRRLEALTLRKQALSGLKYQSGLRPNPELEFEAEDISGSLPGFSQSEWSLSIAQEIELWGARKARMRVAQSEIEVIGLEADIAAFDLYAEASRRFFSLLHLQTRYDLIDKAHNLAAEMVEAARLRVDRGAVHISELKMAELELAQSDLHLDEAKLELANAKQALAVLWNGRGDEIKSVSRTANIDRRLPLEGILRLTEDSREMARLAVEQESIRAEMHSALAEARPSPSIRAGIKRLNAENINTFLIGVALPLPLFNRNQGRRETLRWREKAMDAEMLQARFDIEAELTAMYEKSERYRSKLETLERDMIPMAEATFASLQDAYEKGKLSYLALLEGQRSLLDLQHEKNDTILMYHMEVNEIEKLLGVRLTGPIDNFEE